MATFMAITAVARSASVNAAVSYENIQQHSHKNEIVAGGQESALYKGGAIIIALPLEHFLKLLSKDATYGAYMCLYDMVRLLLENSVLENLNYTILHYVLNLH